MVGEPVEQSGGHLGVAEYGRPLAEGQVRRDDDGRPLVEPADEVEEELAARLGKWEIAQFVHDDEVEPGDEVGQPSLFAATCLRLEPIDEVDDVEEAAACAIADQSTSKGDGQVRLSRAGSADQNDIVLLGEEGPGCELAHQAFVDRRVGEVEVVDVLGQRQFGDGDLVFDGARLLLGDLRLKQVTDDLSASTDSAGGPMERLRNDGTWNAMYERWLSGSLASPSMPELRYRATSEAKEQQ